ncbi:MAG: DUF1232 domain-containing protein [Deltaproteobacteria bacterium]|nr:DUF1232 domain-containing protein [Deltaproteobacteria bacterium]
MAAAVDEKQFIERLRELLVTLPYDLKVLHEILCDEDLPKEARRLAAGAVVYCLSPSDPIPDQTGLVGFVDDVVLVRSVLHRVLEMGGDDAADYPARFGDQFNGLAEDLSLFRSQLGSSMNWIDARLERLTEPKYKGKTIAMLVDDDEARELLYEDSLAFGTEYEIDDEKARRLASAKPVVDAFRKRQETEDLRRR